MNHFVCECCQLPFVSTVRPPAFDEYVAQTMCEPCIEHRGVDGRMKLRRAEEHERELWGRLQAVRAKANEMQEQRNAAFRSRDRAIGMLNKIRNFHEPSGTRGGCRCGVGNCQTLLIVENPWLTDRISDWVARQDGWLDGGSVNRFGINPPRRPRGNRDIG